MLRRLSTSAPAFALLAWLALPLVGCGKAEESAPPAAKSAETEVQAAPRSEVPEESKDQPKIDDSVKPPSVPAPVSDQPVDVPDPSGE